MALKAKSNETDESSDDKDSKMKSYITRQFKKFMKNANVKGFDKDHKQCNSSQFKSQDRGKKEARDGGQYIVLSGPKCFECHRIGHMKQECPTYLKSIGKYQWAWSAIKYYKRFVPPHPSPIGRWMDR